MKTHTVTTQLIRRASDPGEGDAPAIYAIRVSVHAEICIDDRNIGLAKAKLVEDLIDAARTLRLASLEGGK